MAQYKAQVIHLDAELSAVLQRMMYLERGNAYYGGLEDTINEEEFMFPLFWRCRQTCRAEWPTPIRSRAA
ncbi:unnamed protein product [Larinioides sclopetarius]|uniref:Uncharacterized protein n=1 Tax=Larinioides sclopetarius TaxID=280406 RepID=A0AAV1ZB49_9ARAC